MLGLSRHLGGHHVPHPAGTNTSCCPRYSCTVLFGLHAQSGNTGGLAVRVHVKIISIDAGCHTRRSSEQAAHMSLSHVTSGTRHTQKIGHPTGGVGMRRHTGSHSVTGHNTAWHWRGCTAATNPRRILDLK